MKRISLAALSLCALVGCASVAEAVDHHVRQRGPQAGRSPSVQLPRLQRAPEGRLLGAQWQRDAQLRGAQQNARTASPLADTRRQGGRFASNDWKRGGGRWPKVDPQSTAGRGGKLRPTRPSGPARGAVAAGRGGKMLKGAGAIGAAVGVGSLAAYAIEDSQRLQADLRAGRITQSQYDRAQATNALEAGGTLLAIKKMTPASMAANALVGTDPIGLGVDAVGDLINGTRNAEKSLARVGKKLEAHGKGLEKLVTHPAAWAEEAGRNIDAEVKKTERDIHTAARDVDNFFKGIFK